MPIFDDPGPILLDQGLVRRSGGPLFRKRAHTNLQRSTEYQEKLYHLKKSYPGLRDPPLRSGEKRVKTRGSGRYRPSFRAIIADAYSDEWRDQYLKHVVPGPIRFESASASVRGRSRKHEKRDNKQQLLGKKRERGFTGERRTAWRKRSSRGTHTDQWSLFQTGATKGTRPDAGREGPSMGHLRLTCRGPPSARAKWTVISREISPDVLRLESTCSTWPRGVRTPGPQKENRCHRGKPVGRPGQGSKGERVRKKVKAHLSSPAMPDDSVANAKNVQHQHSPAIIRERFTVRGRQCDSGVSGLSSTLSLHKPRRYFAGGFINPSLFSDQRIDARAGIRGETHRGAISWG